MAWQLYSHETVLCLEVLVYKPAIQDSRKKLMYPTFPSAQGNNFTGEFFVMTK